MIAAALLCGQSNIPHTCAAFCLPATASCSARCCIRHVACAVITQARHCSLHMEVSSAHGTVMTQVMTCMEAQQWGRQAGRSSTTLGHTSSSSTSPRRCSNTMGPSPLSIPRPRSNMPSFNSSSITCTSNRSTTWFTRHSGHNLVRRALVGRRRCQGAVLGLRMQGGVLAGGSLVIREAGASLVAGWEAGGMAEALAMADITDQSDGSYCTVFSYFCCPGFGSGPAHKCAVCCNDSICFGNCPRAHQMSCFSWQRWP